MANLAVAYELNGNLDSSFYWVKRSLELNPSAHYHSEWIHLQILEAKRQLQKDSNWLSKNEVTAIKDTLIKYDDGSLHPFAVDRVFEQFVHQLNERIPFTIEKDQVLGKMIFELGNAYLGYSIYRSYYCYALAKYFNPDLTENSDARIFSIQNLYKKYALQTKQSGFGSNKEKTIPTEKEITSFIEKIKSRKHLYIQTIAILDLQKLLSKV